VFDTVLVADRGEIALRIVRTCQRLGIKAVTVHSEADAKALHAVEADESVLLGPAPAAQSYLDAVRVIEAAQQTRAEAVHPGYGYLAEDAVFAQAVLDAGLAWVGPSPEVIALMNDKVTARAAVAEAGVPVAPGCSTPLVDVDEALAAASALGYPVIVKPSTGGGGVGMGVARDEAELRGAFATAARRTPAVLLEKFLDPVRHVEVQVLGLGDGRVVTLGDRDCSVQRRHQKLVEEAPAPGLAPAVRARLLELARTAALAVGYRNAGTVEFLVAGEDVHFLEMNPRLQVEHPVTEAVTGVDLVEQQLLVAAGEEPTHDVDLAPRGHAVELRVYAEDPVTFRPGPGGITRWQAPAGEGIRVDAGYRQGDVVTQHYDPLLAKVIASGATREEALDRARAAVAGFAIEGPSVNLPLLSALLEEPAFVSGSYDTRIVERMRGSAWAT
jgi:acetyl-CoA carboxylase biotin carboxylase subunit